MQHGFPDSTCSCCQNWLSQTCCECYASEILENESSLSICHWKLNTQIKPKNTHTQTHLCQSQSNQIHWETNHRQSTFWIQTDLSSCAVCDKFWFELLLMIFCLFLLLFVSVIHKQWVILQHANDVSPRSALSTFLSRCCFFSLSVSLFTSQFVQWQSNKKLNVTSNIVAGTMAFSKFRYPIILGVFLSAAVTMFSFR